MIMCYLLVASACWAEEAIPFKKIYQDWSSNPFKAERIWVGETVCVEGEIASLGKNVNGGPTIVLIDPSGQLNSIYFFGFKNVPDRFFDVEKGQIVKLKGKIFELEKSDKGGLLVWIDYAQFSD